MKKLTFGENAEEVKIFRTSTELEVELDHKLRVLATKIYPKCNFCSEEIKSRKGFESSQPTIVKQTFYDTKLERIIVGEIELTIFNNWKIDNYLFSDVIVGKEVKEKKYFSKICENCVKQLYEILNEK